MIKLQKKKKNHNKTPPALVNLTIKTNIIFHLKLQI